MKYFILLFTLAFALAPSQTFAVNNTTQTITITDIDNTNSESKIIKKIRKFKRKVEQSKAFQIFRGIFFTSSSVALISLFLAVLTYYRLSQVATGEEAITLAFSFFISYILFIIFSILGFISGIVWLAIYLSEQS